eukprot:g7145.t1
MNVLLTFSRESKTVAQAVLQHTVIEVFCEIPIKDLRVDSLTELDLSGKHIQAHGAIVLAGLIKVSSALKRLTINVELDIEQLKTAATIDLSGKGLKVEEAIVVAKCIKMNSALKTLNISKNSLCGDTSVSGYIKKGQLQGSSFKKGDTVEHCGRKCIVYKEADSDGDLKVKYLGDISGMKAIAEALLWRQFFQAALAAVLPNSALNSLDLRKNGFAARSGMGKAICDAWQGKDNVLVSMLGYHTCEMWKLLTPPSA